MYNRYIPSGERYEPVGEEPSFHAERGRTPPPPPGGRRPPPKGNGPLDGIFGKLGGVLKNFHLESLDRGDILLVLILLFLFLESDDNLELVITLGLLLAFGLFGKDGEKDKEREEEG